MIEGVKLIPLKTHLDERGFFREVLRVGDIEAFGQWSHSLMHTGTIKAFHVHRKQWDYWYVPVGVVKAVVVNMNGLETSPHVYNVYGREHQPIEYLLGDNQFPAVLVIPPGVAHGLKVLQGPAHLFYVTSRVYDPADEGRIAFDALGYDWYRVDIK